MIRRSLWAATGCFCLLLLGSCQSGKKGAFTVSGTFKNADKLTVTEGPVNKVYLLELSMSNRPPVLLDSAPIPADHGHFTLSTTARPQGLYEIAFGNNVLNVPLVNDTPEVALDVDMGKRDDFYDVRGSEGSSQLKDLITVFGQKNYEAEREASIVDSLHRANAPDSVQNSAMTTAHHAIDELSTYLKEFINSNPNPTVAALALTWGTHSFSKSDFETALNDLLRKYPANQSIRELKQGYDQESAQLAQQQSEEANWIGKQAPDLSLPDVNGNQVSIASFRGKYLLVDFWASWCMPCRAENPNVVKAHNAFRHKNFAILGVSLDKDKGDWQKAIQADSLDWTQVSDLKYWNSKAVETFKFEGIPYNLLIDPQGKVIAAALRGSDLDDELRKVLP